MSSDMYIQDDLHAWLERSLDEFVAIKKLKEGTYASDLSSNRRDDFMKKMQRIQKAKEGLERKVKSTAIENPRRLPTASTPAPVSQKPREVVATPDIPKNSGREYLHLMVKTAANRVQAARAGRIISDRIFDKDRTSPPILRSFLTPDRATPDSSIVRRSARSSLGNLSTDEPETYHSKPHVSFTSGKLENPLHLPTFPEYCASLNIDMAKGTTKAKVLRKAEDAIVKLNNFKKRMNDLEREVRKHNSPELGVRGQRRRKTIFLHSNTTNQSVEQGTQPAHRRTQSNTIEEEQSRYERECAMTKAGVVSSDAVIKRRVKIFKELQRVQNQRTIDIMDRVEMEKAFVLRRKIKLVHGDTEKFKDYSRVIGKFSEYKRNTEVARKGRVELSRRQAKIYESLLEVLRVQETDPTEVQLLLLESVRRVLEEGWTLESSDYFLVMSTQILENLTAEERSCKDLGVMLAQMRRHLSIAEADHVVWMQRRQQADG